MSAASLQASGRDAYKRKDYTKALEYFNRAIGRGDPSPQLLDNLAATHDKLEDYKAALVAAKKAIQAGRDDPTGYLRAGLVLKKMEKPSVALEIYTYGLKSVKHVGQGYEQLKKMHDELQKELAPKNSVDPLSMLPRELALHVLEFLSFRQRIAICRVSKGWMKFIRSEPNLWTDLNLSGARAKVKSSFVSVAINTARKKLTAATLSRLYDFDKVLTALVRHCELQSLTLAATGLQGPKLVHTLANATTLSHIKVLEGTEISSDILVGLLRARASTLEAFECTLLESFNIDSVHHFDLPSLVSFQIKTHASVRWPRSALNNLAQKAPNLRRLTVQEGPPRADDSSHSFDLRPCTNLEYLDLAVSRFDDFNSLSLPASIRVLKLKAMKFSFGFLRMDPNKPILRTMADLPELLELELDMTGIRWEDIEAQFSVCRTSEDNPSAGLSRLRSLSLRQVSAPDGNMAFPMRLSGVQYFSSRDTPTINDGQVESILDGLKNVSKLDLSGTWITGVAVKSVVKAGHLKELVVNDCQKLSRDAVDWARSQGLKVEFRMTSSETGGKKIRY